MDRGAWWATLAPRPLPPTRHTPASACPKTKCGLLVAESCGGGGAPRDSSGFGAIEEGLISRGSPPGSSVHGILQAGVLEWVAIPYSRGSS